MTRKKTPRRSKQKPLCSVWAYEGTHMLVRHIRAMERFLDEHIETNPRTRDLYSKLHDAYIAILNEEFAPFAFKLALAIAELEDAYPEIERPQRR
jgi:hypothetical protein